jgi:methylmalonyl-CoA mutase cobalamin-binding subunit
VHDLTCVVHLHSTYSDGTGTVPQIAHAAKRAGVDLVLLTDHDTLEAKRRGEERWYDSVLVLVGEEVTPPDRDHFLAFGIEREISPRLSGPEICEAVHSAGGFGFAAHPFSRGSERFKRPGMPFSDLDCLEGIELWSFLNDTGERVRGFRDLARMIIAPQRAIGGPPQRNLSEWDRMCQARRVVAIGGLDAHQIGIRIAGHVPIRLMGYARSFRQLHTHVLVDRPPTRTVETDRALVYDALREGRCYIANDEVAAARGFAVWAEVPGGADPIPMGAERAFAPGMTLHARTPQPAQIRLLRDGELVTETTASELHHSIELHGVYRIEAFLHGRAWIFSNPVYIRA